MTPNIQPIAWTPDADPTTPGVITSAYNFVPTTRGYAPDFGLKQPGQYYNALPSDVYGAEALRFSNNTTAIVTGTTDAIQYVDPFGTVYDRTRSAGPYFGTVAIFPWYFCAFGTQTLAGNWYDPLQLSADVTTTRFADIAGAPSPGTFCVQRNFVVAGRFGPYTPAWPHGDGWWCSAQEDPTDWAPDIATQCARGRLTATPGDILRLVPFQDYVIAFKERSMYRGTYTGPTQNTWSWPVISRSVGIAGPDAVTEAEGVLYWMGVDGFYRFAGGAVQPIRSAPWNWLRDGLEGNANLGRTMAQWDPVRRVVRFHVPRSVIDVVGIAYHPDTDKWGPFISQAVRTLDIPDLRVPTVTKNGDIAVQYAAGQIDSAHRILTYADTPPPSFFTTGDIGDDDTMTTMYRARVRFLRDPTTSTLAHIARPDLGTGTGTRVETVTRTDGKFDVSNTGRWHRFEFEQTGLYEVSGFSIEPVATGKR